MRKHWDNSLLKVIKNGNVQLYLDNTKLCTSIYILIRSISNKTTISQVITGVISLLIIIIINTMTSFVTFYLSYLQETSLLDIERLKLVANEGEEEYINNLPSLHNFSPDEIPTTQRPPLSHFEHAITQPSRCTIPLAMTCLSIVDFLGNLVSPSCNLKFQNGAKYFFCYADENISNEERELLREVYRNGIMHSFFPKGIEIGITYDSSLETKKELFIPVGNKIILNVNFLSNIVIHVLNKIFVDTSIHEVVSSNLQKISVQEFQNMRGIIDNYQNSELWKI